MKLLTTLIGFLVLHTINGGTVLINADRIIYAIEKDFSCSNYVYIKMTDGALCVKENPAGILVKLKG